MKCNELARDALPGYLYVGIGSLVTAALVAVDRPDLASVALASLAGYSLVVWRTEAGSHVRVLANYAVIWLLYSGSGVLVDALRRPNYASVLLATDRQLFGESPAIAWQAFASPWLNEVLSTAYLSYFVYLHWVIMHAFFLPRGERQRATGPLFTALGLGFSLYLLVPASGVGNTFPELFDQPLRGFWITSLLDALVTHTAAPYDCFPSVHVLATGVMLSCDLMHYRRRFWIMLLPSLVMVASTVLLRMHYVVDLIASGVLLVPFVGFITARKPQ